MMQVAEPPARIKKKGPAIAPDIKPTPVVLVVEEVQPDPSLEGGWNLIIYNDDFNTREYVAGLLSSICGLTDDRAYDVMMTAHKFGMAVVGEYTKKVSEEYCEALRAGGVFCDVSKADGEDPAPA